MNINKIMLVAIFIFITSISFSAKSLEIFFSNELKLNINPHKVAHNGNLIILKFDDFVLTHEIVDPKDFIPTVDLTGNTETFMSSLFDIKTRQELPIWLAKLSESTSASFNIQSKNTSIEDLGKIKLYFSYNDNEEHGVILILNGGEVHWFSVMGEKNDFNNIVKLLKE